MCWGVCMVSLLCSTHEHRSETCAETAQQNLTSAPVLRARFMGTDPPCVPYVAMLRLIFRYLTC